MKMRFKRSSGPGSVQGHKFGDRAMLLDSTTLLSEDNPVLGTLYVWRGTATRPDPTFPKEILRTPSSSTLDLALFIPDDSASAEFRYMVFEGEFPEHLVSLEEEEDEQAEALKDVLSLHAKREVVTQPGPGPICVECRYVWPCPTRQQITESLGVKDV